MKKRTVIRTEQHEVWVIRQPVWESPERAVDAGEAEANADTRANSIANSIVPRGHQPEPEVPNSETQPSDLHD